MEHLRYDWPKFAEYAKQFITEPLIMLDIGCASGIDKTLTNFDEKIIYYGFDPNIAEVRKLKSENKNPNVKYIEAFIDCGEKKDGEHFLTNLLIDTSAGQVAEVISNRKNNSHDTMVSNNLWDRMELTHINLKIEDFIKEHNLPYVDFIKSDIEDADLGFFKKIESQIKPLKLLSIVAEVSFASNVNDEADLTNLLKKYGFGLCGLTTRTYSSKYLPDLFALNIAAQATSGRLFQGDALYFIDESHFANLSTQQLLKLAIMMDLFNMPDCSAMVLNKCKAKLETSGINIEKALDLLTEERVLFGKKSYKDFMAKFHESPESFFPQSFTLEELTEKLSEKVAKIGDGSLYKIIRTCRDILRNPSLSKGSFAYEPKRTIVQKFKAKCKTKMKKILKKHEARN